MLCYKKIGNQCNFLLVGDGDLKLDVLQYAAKKNVSLVSTSWVTPIATALYTIDILVLTSLNEGTPLSIVEAGFCGKPTVAINVGGVKDIIEHNLTGILINEKIPFYL